MSDVKRKHRSGSNGLTPPEWRNTWCGNIMGWPVPGLKNNTICGFRPWQSEWAFTCYLCFSCFCFSSSSFPSPGCWWRAAWRHSRVLLLQENQQHSGHMVFLCQCKKKKHSVTAPQWKAVKAGVGRLQKCATFHLYPLFAFSDSILCRGGSSEWISCSIFIQCFLPPSAWTMMSSWTGINPTCKPQQKERRGLHENNVSLHIWLHLPHKHSFFSYHQKCIHTCVCILCYFNIA